MKKYRVINAEVEWPDGSGMWHQIGSIVQMEPWQAHPYMNENPPRLEDAPEEKWKPPPNIEGP